ncbi:hypothetical protein T02_16230 [Trichinella nativa]|uniref:Uncharacterized protein n=1 Tax=Trichinella nativa TaxID=6335 RepID=A0A0V1KJW7_9BILA|nr:hypothetical protein T02_16230 [Trichinella nativa]
MDELRQLFTILGLVIVDDRVWQHIPKIIHDNWKQGRENFLFLQHLAPCSSVAKNQAELLMKHGLCLIPDHIHSDLAESLIEGRINLIKATKQKKRNFAADNLVFVMNYVPGLFYRPASIVILTGGIARRLFQHGDLATDLPMKQKAKNIADIQLPSDDEPSQSASQESSICDQTTTESPTIDVDEELCWDGRLRDKFSRSNFTGR